jgi:hypothetical protein
MKITGRPTLATVLYGLLCGVSFIPAVLALSQMLYWDIALRLTIWLCLAGYLILLTRWARVTRVSVVIALLLLLVMVFWGGSTPGFLFCALGILSWVRSGICFQKGLIKSFSAEAALSLGGGVLLAYFTPHSTATWAMAIWMFFLVQSLYFVLFREGGEAEQEKVELDPFEQAKRRAEKILSTELQ